MDGSTFQALVVRKTAEKQYESHIETRSLEDSRGGVVLFRIIYPSIN